MHNNRMMGPLSAYLDGLYSCLALSTSRRRLTLMAYCLFVIIRCGESFAQEPMEPLFRVVDMSIGESVSIELPAGDSVSVKLIDVKEKRDSISDAVRRAEVTVAVDGEETKLVAANYNLPQAVGPVQIDCSVTRGYNSNGSASSWGLDKDARIRVWPSDSPWIRPKTFQYPVKQRWFATMTQMANEPTYVDGGEKPSRKKIYYHSGLDIGGDDGHVEVVAATDGLIVSTGDEVLEGHREDTPVAPRYDVVYVLDARGWYYRYSHLASIDGRIRPGRVIRRGSPIGTLGKEGGSGGWSHLHFEIKARQPSGKWGTQAGYAFLWQSYIQQYKPKVVAVARPHHFVFTGEDVTLDAGKSWAEDGEVVAMNWTLHDGSKASGPIVQTSYSSAGTFSEVVKVSDSEGNVSYDFTIVQVIDRDQSEKLPPSVHPTYAPSFGIHPGDPVQFSVRTFRTKEATEVWDFGDGTPKVTVHSDGNADKHNPDGYARTSHRFNLAGDYVVRVESTNEHGLKATGHVHVRVEPRVLFRAKQGF